MGKALRVEEKQETRYAVPLWLRDEQIRVNTARVKGRIQPYGQGKTRAEPIAVVGYGPSLNETWEAIRSYPFVMTCSGSHKFLLERDIVPNWHVEVDPRAHKIALIGPPHPDVEYLIASTCHPKVFDHLDGFRVSLWHVFADGDEAFRILPPGEWALTGGCDVGMRAMTIARFFGFTNIHIFGMDGCEGATGKHAAAHPNQGKDRSPVEYKGVTYFSTPAMVECARQTFKELDQMPDVVATFHGTGLIQHMAQHYERAPVRGSIGIAFNKPVLISEAYRQQNAQLHSQNLAYGVGGGKHAPTVLKLAESIQSKSILDYGCGKGYLAKAIPFPIWEYDPAIPGKDAAPRPAELVVCTDVLEHIEREKLVFVLQDLARVTQKIGYFVIYKGPAQKTLPDGRNTHLIQKNRLWWQTKLERFFTVGKVLESDNALHIVVATLGQKVSAQTSAAVSPTLVAPVPHLIALASLQMRAEPYPIGLATAVLAPDLYQRLTLNFPPLDLFKKFTGADEKYSLSERNHPEAYQSFIQEHRDWSLFHDYIKSEAFIGKIRRVLGGSLIGEGALRPRFEFSMLPANGGLLRPHRDLPSKVVTLVLSMLPTTEKWDPVWGGGTDVLVPKDPDAKDYTTPRDAFDLAHSYPYAPNQAVVFVKSDNSWHAVGPCAGPSGRFRNTCTINLEKA